MAELPTSNQGWQDPWLHLREKTAQFNDLKTIAHRYNQMRRLALQQLEDLRDRPKTMSDTIDTLGAIISFCAEKGDPLWERACKLESELVEETERLNHGA